MWNRAQRNIKHLPTDVYRVYDEAGALLYVGASINVFKRMNEHKAYAPWWPHAHTATVHQYPDRATARGVEALAIRDESPRFNVTRELTEERRAVISAEPIDVMELFWEQGKVWVNADATHQNDQTRVLG